jgi:hypothetical protein
MNDDDDDVLARINLHAWRVPPPPAADRPSILSRALSPAAPRTRSRSRVTWMFAALAIANVVLAAIIVIIIVQRPPPTTVTVQPAGGGSVDRQTGELLRRLEEEQRKLERELADVQQLRTAVEQLAERVRQCEADRRERPGPKPRRELPEPVDAGTCDEVSCVLTNYEGDCCATFRRRGPAPRTRTSTPALPDTLDRRAIMAGIAAVRAQVLACGQHSTAKRTVKVRLRVAPSGHVESTFVEQTPEPALGFCVASAIKQATFEPTHHGGSFSYPFVFGASP